MEIRELTVPDAFEITPRQFVDDRGIFLEWYRSDALEVAVGHPLNWVQANTSVSRRGVVRGIHFADFAPSQAKYVTANRGAVLDYIIDLRVGSPTFGTWDSVLLEEENRRAVYIAEGLGHAFVALSNDATVSYLVSAPFNAPREHAINALDADIGLIFPAEVGELILASKDREAPGLAESATAGLLPTWAKAREFYASLGGVS